MKLRIEIELDTNMETTREVVMALVDTLPRNVDGPTSRLRLLDSGKVRNVNGHDVGAWEVT